jgi:hypothetical protein
MSEPRTFQADDGADAQTEFAGQIEALMRQPVKLPPAIIVVGDDDIFGITPASGA